MKRPRLIWIATILLFTIVGTYHYFNTQNQQMNARRIQALVQRARVDSSADLADSLIRFHVLANSDSHEDQTIKHMVRDEVLREVVPHIQASRSLEQTRQIIQEKKGELIRRAEEVLRRNGKDYGVTAALGKYSFPTKYYGDFSLPAGEYEAFRMVLGEGKGANWWCVMFPPLCFVHLEPQEEQGESLEQIIEPAADVEGDKEADPEPVSRVRIRWKFLEFFQSLF